WQHREAIQQLEAQALATELIVTILKKYMTEEQTKAVATPSLNWITSFLSFHLSEPLSVKDMAKRANLSPSRFSTVFRSTFGMRPHRYLLKLRLVCSADMLRRSKLSLQDIAVYCGFWDVHHFSKSFKRTKGLWPGAYRTQVKI